ncbi:LysM peptidoglycan-binding domain-containing protein [Chlamydia sp. 17-3921]|uniref:LysM peptidoglycan-binding domain-containing protein n=1 Tax=Chlamydia sp. 17-3921 TaxID=2675798 RepID=UPI00191A8049|nr:LysM peptidoglycan-binding domain-containing protein [Chlamydia sp. 17-3921]
MAARKQIKRLRQILVLSLGLNVLFLLLFYSAIFRKDIYKLHLFSGSLIAKNYRKTPVPEDFLQKLSTSSLSELFSLFSEERYVFGYPMKLWALSIAIQKFDIDISPALSHKLTFIELRDRSTTWLLPNLKEKEFTTVLRYLSIQKYPYTSRGLFRMISCALNEGKVDEDCLYNFCLSPEFLYLRTLLAGADKEISVASLARMIIQGGEELFFSLCNEENHSCAISDQERLKILRAYLERDEPLAALLLLIHDAEVVLHEFSNEDLQRLIRLLPRESQYSQDFLTRLAETPRQDQITNAIFQDSAEVTSSMQEYVIKEGDSLWLIARHFGISIEEIMRINQLSHHRLLPGKVLRLPLKSS